LLTTDLKFFYRFFEQPSNIKFYQNPSSGSRVAPCGQTDRQTDMTKLIVAFRNFTKASNNVFVSNRPTQTEHRKGSPCFRHKDLRRNGGIYPWLQHTDVTITIV